MSSKQTTSRGRDARSVIQLLSSQGAELEAAVARVLAGDDAASKKKALAIAPLVDALATLLTDDADAMESSEEALTQEQLDDEEPRARRDGSGAKVQQRLSSVRLRCEAAAGDAATRRVGFLGTIPREPAQLRSYAVTVLAGAKKHPVEVKSREMSFSLSKALEGVRPMLDELGTALDDVAREGREEQAARAKRNAARARFDEHYDAIVLIAEGLFRLAGLHEQADRIHSAAAVSHEARDDEEPSDPQPEKPAPEKPSK